jgi:hypothetical protein
LCDGYIKEAHEWKNASLWPGAFAQKRKAQGSEEGSEEAKRTEEASKAASRDSGSQSSYVLPCLRSKVTTTLAHRSRGI